MSNQQQICSQASHDVAEKCRIFSEIMTGPNPISQEELKALIEKNPRVYGPFKSWLKS